MKYIKRATLTPDHPIGGNFIITEDGRIDTDTNASIRVPNGDDADRPIINQNGMIRYNTALAEFEVYNGTSPGTGWEKMRTVRPGTIYVQDLGYGDYIKTQFGPLRWATGELYTNYTNPQNIFVFVENVFQIPGDNYTLVQSSGAVYINFVTGTEPAPPSNKKVRAYLGIDGYFPPFPSP